MQKFLKQVQNAQIFHGCLHFRYHGKKYIYGISQQLIICGEYSDLLSKLNGVYEPTQGQKSQKSTLLLKKQKTLLKIDFIIIPRKACQNQYLWHFHKILEKLFCRNFLILSQKREGKSVKDYSKQFQLKEQISRLLLDKQTTIINQKLFLKLQFFSQHENCLSKVKLSQKQTKQQSSKKQISISESLTKQISVQSKQQIYEQDIHDIIQQICKRQMTQFIKGSIFENLNPSRYINKIQNHLNTIRNDKINNPQLNLTQQQIRCEQIELRKLIRQMSESERLFYPTSANQIKLILLPNTSMVTVLNKDSILLINPCNLASWKLQYLHLPVEKVQIILLTRFSMAFVQFIVTWSIVGKMKKVKTYLNISTTSQIYQQIKTVLKQTFLWDDSMIRSKISFRVIKTQYSSESRQKIKQTSQTFYPLGFIQICYSHHQTTQDKWIIKFGNKKLCYMNQLIILQQNWNKIYQYMIFDRINQNLKKDLYKRSIYQKQTVQKLIFNRSSSSKFKHKYFKFLQQKNPIITIKSQLRIQQSFIPYHLSRSDTQRYSKIKLLPEHSINCLDRNIIIIEGLVGIIYDEFYQMQINKKIITKIHTKLILGYPPNFFNSNSLQNLKYNKIKNVKEIIALKESVLLIEEKQSQILFQNDLLSKKQQQQKMTSSKIKFIPLNNQLYAEPNQLQICKVQNNSLLKLISKRKNNFSFSTFRSSTQQASLTDDKQQIQIGSPLWQLNQIFKKMTFQSGQIINQDNQKVYFILKGSLRWKNMDQNAQKATNNFFIGNLKKLYFQKIIKSSFHLNIQQHQLPVSIEVIKDSWTLEANIIEFHQKFLVKYPEVAYLIISKGTLFD